MAVETATDLAGMFSEDEFAEAASYQPPGGGEAIACTVIVNRGQARQTFRTQGDTEAATSERTLWAQLAELPAVARDGVFTMLDADGAPTGEVFKVAGKPKLDETAAIWRADLLIVD